MRRLKCLWSDQSGALSFEWISLLSLMTIGIVGGLAVTRDAVVDELADVAEAITSLDQSYTILPPLAPRVHDVAAPGNMKVYEFRSGHSVQVHGQGSGASGSQYRDTRPEVERPPAPQPQESSNSI